MNRLLFLFLSLLLIGLSSCIDTTKTEIQPNVEVPEVIDVSKTVYPGSNTEYVGTYDISKDPNAEKEVLKDLNFGVSSKQYQKTEKKILSKFEDDEVYGYHIGDFGFHSLTPYFVNDELYRIDINGFNKLNYNEILDEISIIKRIFSDKYGSPIYEAEPPKDKELSSNEGVCICEWKAGNKVIQLCFFDFTKAVHSNLLKIIIFRSDMLKDKESQDDAKRKEYSKANTDQI